MSTSGAKPIRVSAPASFDSAARLSPWCHEFASLHAGTGPSVTRSLGPSSDAAIAQLKSRAAGEGEDAAAAATELAAAHDARGERDEARAAYEQAISKWSEAKGAESVEVATATLRLAQAEARAGQDEQALERIDAILSSIPEADELRWSKLRAEARFARASALRRLGRSADALAEAEMASAATADGPASPETIDLYGALLVETGKLDEALDWYEKAEGAQDDGPSDVQRARYALGRGEALVDLGRYEEAVAPLESTLSKLAEVTSPLAEELRPRAQFALAQALRGTGGDEARAVSLATAARDRWSGRKDQLTLDRLGRIEAFLSE
jgi:tetratricopeptide (TPR) repeat protein